MSLSCAAKSSGVAVVANLAENDPTAGAMYNVDVAFDTDGTFLAKYRKQNLWVSCLPVLDTAAVALPQIIIAASLALFHDVPAPWPSSQGEWYMTTPQSCPIVSFTPKFNVTFGLFTCADLIYPFPAAELVDQGVRNFLMPAAWTDEMAQMQVTTPSCLKSLS